MSHRRTADYPPWMTHRKLRVGEPLKGDPMIFHQEIMNFVRYIKLNSEEKAARNAVVEALSAVISSLYPNARVRKRK